MLLLVFPGVIPLERAVNSSFSSACFQQCMGVGIAGIGGVSVRAGVGLRVFKVCKVSISWAGRPRTHSETVGVGRASLSFVRH